MFLKESRTENSIKNVKISTVIYFFSILLQFINRTFFLKFLSINYLGINGLFSNVLSLLNLTELGIGSAMAFALYEPCSCENQKLIKQIMYLYKKVYIVLGIIILIVGIIITPFLDFFIETPPQNIGNYHLYYVLYVINISISYFYTYKRSLIICYQKQYISSITTFLKNLFICIFQIITLYLTRSYVVYLIVQIIFTFLENIFISRIADKMYPFLEEKTTFPPKSIINNIKKNVLAMSFHKIGSVIVTGTDNLIITKFVSLSATGIYSNYLIIISSINSFLTQIFSSITASVGNLISEKDENKIYSVFKNILFLYDAEYYNLVEMINMYFSQIKSHAVILKLIGIFVGFFILSIVFSLKKSLKISFAVLLSLLFAISIFSILSIDINIFAVFGFILAGAVGIDYAVLMLNENINELDRYFGIFTSALTSMVSFVILTTSATYAVFTFGLSVALSLFIFLYILPLFAFYNKKAGINPHN